MSDAAPDSPSTIYKTLTWILVAALIGLYALYNWYQGTLKQGLASQDSQIAQTVQRLSAAESELQAATATEQGLMGEIARPVTTRPPRRSRPASPTSGGLTKRSPRPRRARRISRPGSSPWGPSTPRRCRRSSRS
ncbi:MAG: hypothetical protein H6R22_1361 [Chromatiaceae bacterium]|nr:hypothetical protein [Chromatiaceae bacterium]